ncbi:MAG: hypothetical protein E7266_09815 [Lachnospiraceae bacterium]|nr:hypothetical protein [Lachnospiraceae bacterium]
MINLHILYDEKSTQSTINTLRKYFSTEENPFLIIGNRYGYDYSEYENVVRVEENFYGIKEMFRQIKKSDRVHLHGFFYIPLIFAIALSKKLGQKCNWIMWGQDLYNLVNKPTSFPLAVLRIIRKQATKNIRYITTNVEGDYELLKKVMNKEYKFFKVRFAPFAIDGVWEKVSESNGEITEKNKTINILLGNSATYSNCHLEALDILSKYKEENMKIYIPLSYGDKKYGNQVSNKAKEIFGDKAVPMFEFLEREKYFQLLSNIDIVVFAHNRQQAVGNIVPLLYAGKKIYIRSDISTWPCIKEEYKLDVRDYCTISEESFDDFKLNSVDLKQQQMLCEQMVDEDMFVKTYRKVLEDDEKVI